MNLLDFGRIWLELTLAYFYNPISTAAMIFLLRTHVKIKIVRALLLALLVNGLTIMAYALFVAMTGYETILSLRLNSFFASYLTVLFTFNLIVQSAWIIMLNIHKRAPGYFKRLLFITVISNFIAFFCMATFIKYGIIR